MSKRPFVIFGIFVAVLAVVIPLWAFNSSGDPDKGSRSVPPDLSNGKTLFVTNCGTCHTLYAAGTDGNFGPNLDIRLAPAGPPSGPTAKQTIATTKGRVSIAIKNGIDTNTPGRMPAGIISGAQADKVANFVAHTAGQG